MRRIKVVNNALYSAMKEEGIEVIRLGEITGYSHTTIRNLINGKNTNPTLKLARTIASAVGKNIDQVFLPH